MKLNIEGFLPNFQLKVIQVLRAGLKVGLCVLLLICIYVNASLYWTILLFQINVIYKCTEICLIWMKPTQSKLIAIYTEPIKYLEHIKGETRKSTAKHYSVFVKGSLRPPVYTIIVISSYSPRFSKCWKMESTLAALWAHEQKVIFSV